MREALRQLEGDGLVVHIPQKGMVVATMTKEEAEEVYQVRAVVEGLAGRLCALQMTEELGAALKAAMKQVEAAHHSGTCQRSLPPKASFIGFCWMAAEIARQGLLDSRCMTGLLLTRADVGPTRAGSPECGGDAPHA